MTAHDTDIPGSIGTLRQRIEQVIDNETPVGYTTLLKDRVSDVLDDWEAEALERAKAKAREMLASLMPGNTGVMMADEVATKVMAAALASSGKPLPKSVAVALHRVQEELILLGLPEADRVRAMLNDAVAAQDYETIRSEGPRWPGSAGRRIFELADAVEMQSS